LVENIQNNLTTGSLVVLFRDMKSKIKHMDTPNIDKNPDDFRQRI